MSFRERTHHERGKEVDVAGARSDHNQRLVGHAHVQALVVPSHPDAAQIKGKGRMLRQVRKSSIETVFTLGPTQHNGGSETQAGQSPRQCRDRSSQSQQSNLVMSSGSAAFASRRPRIVTLSPPCTNLGGGSRARVRWSTQVANRHSSRTQTYPRSTLREVISGGRLSDQASNPHGKRYRIKGQGTVRAGRLTGVGSVDADAATAAGVGAEAQVNLRKSHDQSRFHQQAATATIGQDLPQCPQTRPGRFLIRQPHQRAPLSERPSLTRGKLTGRGT